MKNKIFPKAVMTTLVSLGYSLPALAGPSVDVRCERIYNHADASAEIMLEIIEYHQRIQNPATYTVASNGFLLVKELRRFIMSFNPNSPWCQQQAKENIPVLKREHSKFDRDWRRYVGFHDTYSLNLYGAVTRFMNGIYADTHYL